ncbi:MAG TPA: hypothetical protein VGE07_30060 [Herpetosiphonaceae bacterium]
MALFHESLIDEIAALVRQRYHDLGVALGEQPPPGDADDYYSLRGDLRLLIAVANGGFMRTDSQLLLVEQALARLLGLLLGNPLGGTASFPEDFWETDLGIVILRVRWWVHSDDLITISNAAALAFGENTQANRMRIARAIDKGLLDWVPDPSVSNQQQNRRVLRPQVERMRELSRLPE